jgi:Protein of unknown function (DUF3592)
MFQEIYSSLSNFAILIIMIILCIILFIIPAIVLIYKIHEYNYKSSGVITDSQCSPSTINNKITTCNLTINYPANNRQYTGVDVDEEGAYSNGNSVPVYYDNANPRAFIVKHYRIKTIGYVLLALGIIFISMLITHYIKYNM